MNDVEPREPESGTDRRSWLFATVVVVALVIVATSTVLFTARSQDATYPPGSPESAFQRYVQAWDAGDTDTAYAALSGRARSRVPEREFREASNWSNDGAVRVWIDERSGTDDRVVLELTVETSQRGLLGADRYRDHPRVTLVREDGSWKIDTPLVGYHPW